MPTLWIKWFSASPSKNRIFSNTEYQVFYIKKNKYFLLYYFDYKLINLRFEWSFMSLIETEAHAKLNPFKLRI